METIKCSDNPKIMPAAQILYGSQASTTVMSADEKKPITKELRALKIGESAEFPIERRSSVVATAQRLKKDLMRVGWNFKLVDNTEDFTVSVIRIPS
ncbi:hypothetical protein [Bacteroides acidifaciens]|jgi:pyruvate/oxaloacetate carboxyltransferase|uniref:hypothetical protein n=2 Tax=Bacteroidales TaxID=171549 RepID=UPI00257029C2|nr:hypothetical protein [Bacteroides acidifaciens]